MDGFSIAAKAVIPFVVYIGFGMGVRRTGLVDEPFLRKLNSVIFYCFYPIVVIFKILWWWKFTDFISLLLILIFQSFRCFSARLIIIKT